MVAAAVSGADLGRPYLVLGFVEGEASEEPQVAYEAGRGSDACTPTSCRGGDRSSRTPTTSAHGRYDTPRQAVMAELAGVPDLVGAGVLDRCLADAATTLVRVDALLEPAATRGSAPP